jgi:hypothetical protein
MKYIQSFYQYPVTFSSIGKTIAARNAVGEMKNIVEISEKELEKLKNSEPFFRELLNKKKIRILDKVPNSYVPPAQQINKAQDEAAQAKAEADRLRKENEAMKAKLAALEGSKGDGDAPVKEDEVIDFDKADYKELQKYAKDLGIDPNQKKAVLIEELKKAAQEAADEGAEIK